MSKKCPKCIPKCFIFFIIFFFHAAFKNAFDKGGNFWIRKLSLLPFYLDLSALTCATPSEWVSSNVRLVSKNRFSLYIKTFVKVLYYLFLVLEDHEWNVETKPLITTPERFSAKIRFIGRLQNFAICVLML